MKFEAASKSLIKGVAEPRKKRCFSRREVYNGTLSLENER